jgi:hypothetical protein
VGHWVMKYQGGQEAGYCSKMVSDRVAIDVGLLYTFFVAFSSTYFRFPSVKPS